jgi:CBS domain-containing protein
MAQSISDVMTKDPQTVECDAPLTEAAKLMKEHDTGAILVTEGEELKGIITDRDITVRAVADGQDPSECKVSQVFTESAATLSPDDSVDDAINLVREHNVRRVPVLEDGKPVGIVSIGDLAIDRDQDSALADLSSSSPNN